MSCILNLAMVFQDTPKMFYRTILANHHSHVTSQQRLVGLQYVLKTSLRHVLKMCSTHLQLNNFSSFTWHVLKTSWRRFQDVLKTSWRCLWRQKIVTLRTSWRRFEDMSWRCLDVETTKAKFLSNILQKYNKWSVLHLKNIFILKKFSTFANLLMKKPANWFAIAKKWE